MHVLNSNNDPGRFLKSMLHSKLIRTFQRISVIVGIVTVLVCHSATLGCQRNHGGAGGRVPGDERIFPNFARVGLICSHSFWLKVYLTITVLIGSQVPNNYDIAMGGKIKKM